MGGGFLDPTTGGFYYRGSAVSVGLGFYGNGVDGAVNMDGTNTYGDFTSKASAVYSLTRDVYCSSLIVTSGSTLVMDNYRIYCSGTIANAGTIRCKYSTTATATGGAVVSGGSLDARGQAGGNGTTTNGANGGACHCYGGAGGTGGTGGGGTEGAGGTAGAPGATNGRLFALPMAAVGQNMANSVISNVICGAGGGGGAGDGANAGGGGGSGGSMVLLCGYNIINTGTITAAGNAGANGVAGNAGGGGGGGGGCVILVHRYLVEGTVSVAGGAGGTKAGTGGDGAAGSTGVKIYLVA
jgi:hypothetical protein